MRNNLEALVNEVLYLKRLADSGNSYTFWRKSADKAVNLSKTLLVDCPMDVWFETMIRGAEQEVCFYENNLSQHGKAPFNHGRVHRSILWYFNHSTIFREKDYETVLKFYRRIVRLLKEGDERDLFKRRIKKIEKMLKKERDGRIIRHG